MTEAEATSRSRYSGWVLAVLALAAGAILIGLGEVVPEPISRGSQAPSIEVTALSTGAPITLESLRGEVVLLNFWATWCKPCEDEMPAMERLYRQLRAEGFELLAVSVDDDTALVEQFRERLDISFPIAMDSGQKAARLYQTTGFPESILIDRKGRVVERYIGPRDWDLGVYADRIRRLLGQGV